MTDIAIRVEHLSKLYPSGALRAGHIGRASYRIIQTDRPGCSAHPLRANSAILRQ